MPPPFDAFEREYMQLALVAGLVVGACAPLIGTFLVQKRLALLGDGIGHIAFAGVGGGLLLEVWPVWSALVLSVAAAIALDWLRARGTAQGDLLLAMFFYGGIAAGIVLVGVAGAGDASLFAYLFGSILTVDPGEVWVVVALGVAIVGTTVVCGRALFALAIDEEWARVAGLPVRSLNTALSVLVAVTVVASMRIVGILLVAALMVLPVASGQVVARSRRGILVSSVAVGMASVVVGLLAAYQWALAPGGTVVLVAVGAFAVTAVTDAVRRRPHRFPGHGDGAGGDHDPVLNDSQPGW